MFIAGDAPIALRKEHPMAGWIVVLILGFLASWSFMAANLRSRDVATITPHGARRERVHAR